MGSQRGRPKVGEGKFGEGTACAVKGCFRTNVLGNDDGVLGGGRVVCAQSAGPWAGEAEADAVSDGQEDLVQGGLVGIVT